MDNRLAFLTSAVCAVVLAAASSAVAQAFTYTAQLNAATRVSGAVTASGIAWRCSGTTCTTSGPWPTPGVGACHALALQVGRVSAYGRPGAALDAAQLAQCNDGVAANLAVSPNVLNRLPPVRPSRVPVIGNGGSSGGSSSTPPTPGGPIRTITLTITGTGALPTVPPPAPPRTERVATTLTITGTGALPTAAPPAPPRTERIPTTLTITGTGSLTPAP